MDLPQIGAHCSLPSCNLLDFLPITCRCNQSFCCEHISANLHDCPAVNQPTELTKSTDPLQRCFFDGCRRPSLRNYSNPIDETCPACHQSFCAEHRHPETHMCPTSPVQPKPSSFPKPHYSPAKPKLTPKKVPSDPTKFAQWQKMELMKMRHRAAPGDPKDKGTSPLNERIHVKILTVQGERTFWFRKTIVTGRALDLLVAQLRLLVPANHPLKLGTVPGLDDGRGPTLLQNDQLLVNQVEDGSNLSVYSAT